MVRAWHCADIPFAFGNLDAGPLEFLIGGAPTAADHRLSRQMVRAWADFATNGTPGWPPIDDLKAPTRIWNTDDGAAHDEPDGIRALWADAGFPLLRP